MTFLELYARTCQAYRRQRDEEEARSWAKALEQFSVAEVERAILLHQGDTRLDDHGRARGAWMPHPADLKRIVEAQRRNAVSMSRFVPCGECHDGWVFVGAESADGRVRPCQCFLVWIASMKGRS